MAEHAGAGDAAGEGADEVEGVYLDSFAVVTLGELSSGRSLEDQLEWFTVGSMPTRPRCQRPGGRRVPP